MNRFALLAVAIIAIIIAWFVFFAGPTVEPPPPVEAPTVKTAPPPPSQPPAPAPPTPVAQPDEDAGPDAEVDAEAPSGPVVIDLGQHEIMLAERDGRFLQLQLTLTAADRTSAAIVRRKRRTLIRSLFFLVSKRSADGVESAGGEARLVADLLPRFRNQVRAAKIERVDITRFRVIFKEIKTPDGGP